MEYPQADRLEQARELVARLEAQCKRSREQLLRHESSLAAARRLVEQEQVQVQAPLKAPGTRAT